MSRLAVAIAGLLVARGIGLVVCACPSSAQPAHDRVPDTRWHAPTALWLAPDAGTLFAACEKSGRIVALDTATRQPVAEFSLGKSLVAAAATPDGRRLLVCDAGASELVVLDRDGRSLVVRARVPVPIKPVSVTLVHDGHTCFVASLWSRQLTRVDLESGEIVATIDLDFSPRNTILLADGQTLVVAGAFAGKLALVDTQTFSIVRQVDIPGHNIRGLALSPSGRELLVSQMILTESAGTTRDHVFWGITMSSNLRVIPVTALLDREKNPIREAHTHFLGDPGNGAGDPGATAVVSDGTALVCLSGVGELSIGRYSPYAFRRLYVGQRPTAVVVSPDEKTAYVANEHSDTISVIDVPGRANAGEIKLGPEPALSLAEEGERAFYDAKLSLDGWFSCHSCHTDGHTNGQNADTLGDGAFGVAKNVLSLLGTGDTEPWAWNGSKRTLEEQVRESLRTTMQPKSPAGERTVAALTAYMRTLGPPPVAAWQQRDPVAIARGEQVFAARGCAACHAPPTYSNTHLYDVGLDDGEAGNRQFNPPSLRGLAHSAPYFHDGRAKTLEDVLRVHQHRLRTALSDEDSNDLVAFLRSL